MDSFLLVGAIAAGVVATVVAFRNWKIPVWGLLVYLPFAGLPTILFYPAPPVTRILKDIIFLAPAYVAFLAWYLRQRRPLRLPQPIPALMLVFAAIVVGQSFNPAVPDALVALVGLKTWLLYLPLFILAYHFVEDRWQATKFFERLLVIALVPIALGVVQACLISLGQPDLAYGPYGEAAGDVTHGFSRFEIGQGNVYRVASTFTFVSQYYNFVLATLCAGCALWLARAGRGGAGRWWMPFVVALVVVAGFLTGSRGAFVTIPLFFAVVVVVGGYWKWLGQSPVVLIGSLVFAVSLFQTTLRDLFGVVSELGFSYLTDVQLNEFRQALTATWLGFGTGTDTNPARFALTDESRLFLENYYAKTVVELGLLGLVALLVLFAAILLQGRASLHRTKDPVLRASAVAILSFLMVSMFNGWKAAYLDIDPLNVYFWFYAGVLVRLPTLTTPLAEDETRMRAQAHSTQLIRILPGRGRVLGRRVRSLTRGALQ